MTRAAKTLTFICAVSGFLCAPGVAEAQLFKCVLDGKTVYQQERCPEAAKQSTVREPDPLATRPSNPQAEAEQAAKQAVMTTDGLIDVIAGFNACAENVADFGAKYQPAFEDWRTRNAAAMGRFTTDAAASEKLSSRMQAERAKPAGTSRAAQCAQVISAIQPGRGTK